MRTIILPLVVALLFGTSAIGATIGNEPQSANSKKLKYYEATESSIFNPQSAFILIENSNQTCVLQDAKITDSEEYLAAMLGNSHIAEVKQNTLIIECAETMQLVPLNSKMLSESFSVKKNRWIASK